ncbi:GNAT family N-acetyltransferase [Rhodospirillum centenum]|uniref:Acetyltransferase, GNAT family n=1 Tax=Rhodospirillum centenum (strain ATCC 51521 / SW) TaxID=414684 RepID=B6IWG8_RHOCS|nr:GNAT family N-acetyltransferase [Rhodospirillum centenum]ACJ00642.1 acetyltransferase, GNAT family [Rhodospirillum centenum SW]
MGTGITVTPATAGDAADWHRLFAGYCAFYGEALPDGVAADVWRRILEPGHPVKGLLAREADGTVVGLCNYVLHDNTWSVRTDCYLEDLYTDPAARGRGVGRALIERLVATGRQAGWRRVYWHTQEDNATARRLYDRVTGGRDAFVRYTVKLV